MLNRQFILIFLTFLLMCFCQTMNAQQGEVNPFELLDRIPSVETDSAKLVVLDSISTDSVLSEINPFDPNNSQTNNTSATANPAETPEDTGGIPNIWMGGIVLILGVLMAILNSAHGSELSRTMRSFTSKNMLNFNYRSQKGRITTMYLLAYSMYAISMGAFLYLLGWYFKVPMLTGSIYSALICMAFVAVVMLAKHLLIQVIGWIMPFDKELNQYGYTMAVFNQVIGVALLPFIIVAAFAPDPFKKIALFGGVAVILLIYLYRSIRGVMIGGRFMSLHKFHFFLYLCTVEIAPLLILVKVLGFWKLN